MLENLDRDDKDGISFKFLQARLCETLRRDGRAEAWSPRAAPTGHVLEARSLQ